MTDVYSVLTSLRRPRMLIRAAQHGLSGYRREKHLERVLRDEPPSTPAQALSTLLAAEAYVDDIRRAGDVTYSARHHVDLLIALIAEARLILDPEASVP